MDPDTELKELVRKRFDALPPVVQRAILSADVSKHLQDLAKSHNLHLDQWEALENEVQLTLLGVKHSENISENIQSEIGVNKEVADSLASDISRIVFEPVRQELERQLDHPSAAAAPTTGVETMRAGVLADNAAEHSSATPAAPATQTPPATTASAQPTVAPATPPAAPSTDKVERAPAPTTYTPATASHERKTIAGDPYREQLI